MQLMYNDTAAAHCAPLSDPAIAVLASLSAATQFAPEPEQQQGIKGHAQQKTSRPRFAARGKPLREYRMTGSALGLQHSHKNLNKRY
jgi:hypothetical protein